MMHQMLLLDNLRRLECELHQRSHPRRQERLEQLLAPDFKEFGRSGASYTRNDILANLPGEETEAIEVHAQDFSVLELSASIALLTYRSAHVDPSGAWFRHTNRSSIWRLGPSGWQMVFHQGTPTGPFNAIN